MPNVKYLHKFDSWHAYIGAVHGLPQCPKSECHSQRPEDYWTGSTLEEWPELEANGWEAIRPEISQLTNKVTEDIRPMLAESFIKRIGVKGNRVDMGRYLAGSPVCMSQIKPIRTASVGRVVTILVNGGYASGVDESEIKRRGVAICALVEALTVMQHSTEIWIEISMGPISRGNDREDRHVTLVKVKSAEDELDMARLMYAIAHPSALRRTWFAFVETLPNAEFRDFLDFGSYGRPSQNTQGSAIEANIDLPLLKYPFPDALAWVRKHLAEYGLIEGDDREDEE